MKRFLLTLIFASLCQSILFGSAAADEASPREQANAAVREAMAKAQADKAKNDRIVEQQRAAEKAAKPTPSPSSTPPR